MSFEPLPYTPTTAKSLFSHHYLESRVPNQAEWAEDPRPVLAQVQTLWHKAQQLGPTWNEAQTEDEFIKPLLAVLGWSFIPQAKNTKNGRVNRPDYALFADDETKNDAYPHQGHDDAFYGRALAIAEAKYWGRPLSQKDGAGRDTWKTGSNPSHQMVSYLVGTRCSWGILTNGRVWRLYSREASSTASEFYEVDLGEALTSPQSPSSFSSAGTGGEGVELGAFKRFWLFFRRTAFVPDAQGRAFLQRVIEGSATYAREISDKLKELVFDEVMPEIASGFIAYRRQQLGIHAETDESLAEVYQASLSLLYKLLFVLYAEARSLLPISNPAYWEESLTRMARQFAERIDRGLVMSDATHASGRYDNLLALFRRIDQGDPSLGVPRYDGGLFNANTPDNQFLARHKLSDRAVARAVDILVRDAGQPVDYAYISVRNLGAIYEGLLENKLALASPPTPSPLPIRGEERGQSGELALASPPTPSPLPITGDERGLRGELALASPPTPSPLPIRGEERGLRGEERVILVNDKGERKATGSYYTPDYIVEYIVRYTLDPILDGRSQRFAAAMERCADLRRQLGRLNLTAGETKLLRAQLDAAEHDGREAFLGIKVCDPAMGSGHFLVNAVDHLTDGIIERVQAYHDSHTDVPWAWNPLQGLIERVRADILAEMARQGIAVDGARLDDTALLTRLVMKRCIYGVDLNPMAVELAKLSLWLNSFTVGAPLSFLDHHLRWGNSLIGADVRTVEAAIQRTASGQFGLFAGPFAGLLDLTGVMIQIAEQADSTLADVRRSAEDFAGFQASLTPYKQVLDLWVSQHFGNQAGLEFLTLFGGEVVPALKGQRPVSAPQQAAIERAKDLWREKRFFHWDLEFPEVFIDLARRDWAENPGFDAVIGNPPYVATADIDRTVRDYLRLNFRGTGKELNIFAIMTEAAVFLVKQGGSVGFIVPDSFLLVESYSSLRKLILSECLVERVALIRGNAFADAVTGNSVVFVLDKQKNKQPGIHRVRVDHYRSGNRSFVDAGDILQQVYQDDDSSRFFIDQQSVTLLNLAQHFLSLQSVATLRDGIKTGNNNRFVVQSKISDDYRPVLTNSDVYRYDYQFNSLYVLYDRALLARAREEWIFLAPEKLILRQTGDVIVAAYDDRQYYTLDNTHLLLPGSSHLSIKYLLALLNSKLFTHYYQLLSGEADRTYAQIRISILEQLPIFPITGMTLAAERQALAAEGRRLYAAYCASGDASAVMAWVEGNLTSPPAPLLSATRRGEGGASGDGSAVMAWVEGNLTSPPAPLLSATRRGEGGASATAFADSGVPRGEGGESAAHPLGDREKGSESKVLHTKVPGHVVELARKLRQQQTRAEELLWMCLRNRMLNGLKFRRQHPLGRYIADFYCAEKRLVIELDGAIHFHPDQQAYDQIRQQEIEARGLIVLRLRNQQVEYDLEHALDLIANAATRGLVALPPTLPPPLLSNLGEERGSGGEERSDAPLSNLGEERGSGGEEKSDVAFSNLGEERGLGGEERSDVALSNLGEERGPGGEERSDVIHDFLAFLAEQMIGMNRDKQAEVNGFLAWLQREIGASLDSLNNKTRVQNYLGDYQKGEPHASLDDLLAVLRQNRRKLIVDPSRRAFQEHLQAEYAASLDKLLPLKQRLAATDRLIDQVVYRLYGLSDGEIAVVEGR
jgi:very-short-patch-repair endonuclease/type I restriction-modification system DNA methylase subunit